MCHPPLFPGLAWAWGAAGTAVRRHACSAAVLFAVVIFALVDGWLSASGVDGGLWRTACDGLSHHGRAGPTRVLNLSIACIVAGLIATWAFRHEMLALAQHRDAAAQVSPPFCLLNNRRTLAAF
jgi:hypothetical protein